MNLKEACPKLVVVVVVHEEEKEEGVEKPQNEVALRETKRQPVVEIKVVVE